MKTQTMQSMVWMAIIGALLGLAPAMAQQKSQPPTGQRAQMEQRAIQLLRNDPQMRTEFLNRVAAPIANKLFECGLIP